MTVKELKEKLAEYPDHLDVYVAERKTEFDFGYVNSVYKQEIDFMEEPGGSPLSRDTVIVLDEE